MGRDEILAQIRAYSEKIAKETTRSDKENTELKTFLEVQRAAWMMMKDNVQVEGAAKTKERILLETWRKFTEAQRKKSAKKSVPKEVGLEQEASTSGSIVQGDVKVLSEGIEKPVGVDVSATETAAH